MPQDSGLPNDESSVGPGADVEPTTTTDEEPPVGSAGGNEHVGGASVPASLLFRVGELKAPDCLVFKLRYAQDPLSLYLQERFSPETLRELKQYDDSNHPPRSLLTALVNELNEVLKDAGLFDEARFAQVSLTEKTRDLINQRPQGIGLVRLNRLLLEEAYPHEIGRRHVPFRERFALQRWDVAIICIVAVLIGLWVYVRGNLPYQGRLGRPLRVGIVSWPGYAGGLVANNGLRPNKDSDFWNKERQLLVEFVIVEDETELRRRFVNGELDIMWSTVDSLAQQAPALLKEGIHPRAFMQVDWSRGGDVIIASAGIKRIEDLKGKRIAVSMSASQWLLDSSLEHSSLSDDEKEQIRKARVPTNSSEEAGDKFANSEVDAAVLWEPDVTVASKKRGGSHILVDTAPDWATRLIADVMVAKEEFIQQHPDVISAFIEGWLQDGTTKAYSNPMLAVRVLQQEPKFANLGEEETQEQLKKVVWATLDENEAMFGLSGGKPFFDDLFDQASGIWLKNHYITEPARAEQARDIVQLKEIYSANHPPKPGCGADTSVETITLAVPFPPGSAELKDEARNILDNQSALFILQTHTGAHFCVQACPDRGDCDLQPAPDDLSRARENAVIKYLVDRYNRSPNQFVSASASASGPPNAGTATRYIRLKLAGTSNQQ
jgi:NitT/TauT family transport system substrate-binding protein